MGWLAVVALIISAFAIPRFGKVMLGLFGALVALAIIGGIALLVMNKREQAETRAARTRIQKSEVEFADLELGPSYGTGAYRLAGRVRNHSNRYTLDRLKLKFIMRDCTERRGCDVVGEAENSIYVDVPPGQARDVAESIYFSGLGSPRGKHQWDYDIVDILGR